ncbi:MAG: sulfotransferase domain-containing protein [Acidobacteriota bacterium]|nr:MAG: sulfotransferase domain-containing protein [Acidobacteriota bacterium]
MSASTRFKVDFLIVGTQKGGTTALAHFLRAHPSICVAPNKEAHFFDDPSLADLRWESPEAGRRFCSFFPNYTGQPRVGEATPIYMYLPGVPERIRRYNPAMKLILLLREPSDRALSHYAHSRRHHRERLPFPLALMLEQRRLARDWGDFDWNSSLRWHSYTDRGRYSPQIREMSAQFAAEQMLFLKTEELVNDHDRCLGRVFRFLGVEVPDPLPPHEVVHTSERRHWAPAFCRRWVARQCYESTLELEGLTGWDLSRWKHAAGGG